MIILCCLGSKGYAGVTVTPASGGTSICSSKAVGGSAPAYTTLGTITVTEGNITDLFGPATDVLVLNAPAGWQFNTTLPTFGFTTGSNITAITGSITSSTLTINITTNGINGSDQFTITGLQVQATSTASPSGIISTPSVPPGIAGITTFTNFGSLSLTAPVTPSVTISVSPAGIICAGSTATFTPTPANGGAAPAYQWYLNGTSVVTGANYVNSSLANGNTVYCVMTSTGTCVTTTTATSNTLTMTVNPAPMAISGTAITCQGGSTHLSDATPSGTWSSSNTTIALVDGAGNVTGMSVGTAIISYMASGCPAVTMVTINEPPLAPVLTPTLTTMCSGSITMLSTSGTPAPATVLSQNFNSGLGTWTVDNTGGIGMVAGGEWKVCGDGYVNDQGLYHSPDNSSFAMSNADTSGSLSTTSSKLISPVFSLASYSGATLTFQQAYAYWPAGDFNVNLDISTDGGTTWTTLKNYVGSNIGTKTGFVSESFSLNDYLGMSNLMIRYYYYCHWGYFWAIDNILITGISSVVTPTWSPATYLFTDAGLTTPYVGGSSVSAVYAHPPSIGTSGTVVYTVSASSSGCVATSTSTVNYTPTPAPITGTTSVCVGATTPLSDITVAGTWSSSNTAVATVGPGTGVVSGISAGTAVITYSLGSGCAATTIVTVNFTPGTILGPRGLCMGVSSSLSDFSPSGGHWSSTNTVVATIGSVTGIINPVATGTVTMVYTIAGGCSNSTIVTVNPLPPGITGTPTVCVGMTITLSDATSGGTWSSGTPGVAVVVPTTGVVFGASSGTSVITYMLGTGCIATVPVTVNPLLPVTGTADVCAGLSTSLTDALPGGTWSSSDITIATVGSGTGIVFGAAAGVAIISYKLSTGCTATANFTVNPLPASITGTATVCSGLTTSLTDATTGGTWSSGNLSVATIGSATGIVSGSTSGTSMITYVLPTGCQITKVVTVNPLPLSINGTLSVCAGLTTSLTDVTAGGTWSSSDISIATVASGSGLVTGVAQGTAIITYTLNTGCLNTAIVTVNPLPATITGSTNVCVGLTTNLTDLTTGGTWVSSNTAAGTISSSGIGVVTGIGAGTTNISYILPTGCQVTAIVTVNSLPVAISGTNTVCEGLTTSLTDASSGGTWSSSNPAAGSIASGVVTGVAAGTTVITYTLPTGCITTRVVTVNALPGAINGITNVCVASTTNLTDGTTGGLWSSSNLSVGTIGSSSGLVTGMSNGTANITYTLATGCLKTTTITVNPLPPAITGNAGVCLGATTTLSDAVAGTWSSSIPFRASIGSASGIVSGLSTGTVTITYTTLAGCITTVVATVNSLPATITGPFTVCTGASITLTDASAGGAWSSGNISVATIGSGTGTVNGVASGSADITYTLTTGCTTTKTITVNQTPAPISGATSLCQSATTVLSDSYSGGTWSSSSPGIVSIGSASGLAGGFATGTSTITYTYSGCTTSVVVSVNLAPAAISGVSSICSGSTTTLTDISTGGSWASSNTIVAPIVSGTGLIGGLSAGTTTITYTLADGCITSTVFTVNVMPAAITGISQVCYGFTTALSDVVAGGNWSSSNTSIALVGTGTGVVTGTGTGTATITYGYLTGCLVTSVVTVNATPVAISGPANVCLGFSITLSDASAGGAWSSSDNTVATIGSGTGIVATMNTGTTTIYYTFPTGCSVSKTITVNPQPSVISGTTNICAGSSTTLTDAMSAGTWSSSNTAAATIGSSTGLLTGAGAGTTTITYSLGMGCIATTVVTVNLLPSSVAGNRSVCAGSTTTLSDPIGGGGTWSSGDITIATAGSLSGAINGIAAGTVIITYTLGPGCSLTTIVTVNPIPAPVAASNLLCFGGTATMNDDTTGGTWSTSNVSVAAIGSTSGIASGNATGTATITYKLGTGCLTTSMVTVYPLPAGISGSPTVCLGLSVNLSDATTGGTWSSSNMPVATIGSSSGIVSAITAGTTTISYSLATGCGTAAVVTVNPLPLSITGAMTICAGLSTNLTDASPGGTWHSSNSLVATAGSTTGIITGVAAGTAIITYTLPTGCIITTIVTVYPLPANISGYSNVCIGTTMALSDATTGGLWSSSNTVVAIVGSGGLVSGLTAGTAIITYTLATGCMNTKAITVNALPANISGPKGVCIGLSIILSEATTGGSWSSGNTSVASAGSSTGLVNGLTAGSAAITYTLPVAAGVNCITVDTITVDPLPLSISGTRNVCSGSAITLTDASGTGTWSSSNTSIATIGSVTGIVNGYGAGTAIITYTLPAVAGAACITTAIVTVNPLPFGITGTTHLCVGATVTLSDASVGGIWSGPFTSVATIGSATGSVTGNSNGTTNVTYTLPTGCITTQVVTVNPLPSSISGPSSICQGSLAVLSDASSGGSWSSSNTAIATIGSASGILNGVSAGTAIITYTLPTGCSITTVITVNPLPAAISGNFIFCVGLTSNLTDATPGGTWSSNNTGVATAGSLTGLITGISSGTAGITYTLPTGCIAATIVTLNILAPISGNTFVCSGYTSTLTDASGSGTWTSSNTSVASIGFTTGVVTGSSAGTSTISFVLSAGCITSTVITVNSLPSLIAGTTSVCMGLTTSLSDASGTGAWASGNTAVAAIDAGGIVTGVSPGTASITFTIGTGCTASTTVTVNPLPGAISGTTEICVGLSAILTDASPGGRWSSSNPAIAAIGSATGIMTGMFAGNTNITYTLPTGCITVTPVTIDPLPAAITGTMSVCAASATILSDVTPGGTWSSTGSAGILTIDGSSGTVTGVSAGTAVVSYMLLTGCIATSIVTVNPLPAPITGGTAVCAGLTITLSDASAGGSWSAGLSPAVSVGAGTGVVTGLSAGVGLVTYTLPTGCMTTWAVTVNPLPEVITGTINVCAGLTTTLSDATAGGTWSSGATAIANIGTSGIVTGNTAGTSIITYTLATGCIMTTVVTVNPLPSVILGATNVCTGLTINLSDITPGGHWSSSNGAIATVGSGTGAVDGISAGSATITYMLPTGCIATYAITVNPLPAAITGTLDLCVGATASVSDATAGGAWSSGTSSVASIGTGSGIVSGLIAGNSAITYTLTTGCISSAVVTVDPLPAPVSGTLSVCAGLTTYLTSSGGGAWSSSTPAVCIIGTGGGATGISAGTSVITYALPTGCLATAVITVNPLPVGITGPGAVCTGTTISLTDATPGGTWSITTSGGVASVGSASGVVTGISSGLAIVTYTIATGCITTRAETVFATPSSITGAFAVCAGSTAALSNATASGTWSSSDISVASVGSSNGIVTGIAAGTTIITYALGTGCYTASVVTVNPLPVAISGPNTICTGLAYNLSDATTGGNWASGTPGVAAIVFSTGTLTGLTKGTTVITYTLPTGCNTTMSVTVNPSPVAITGANNICAGAFTVLSDTSAGGTWSSSDTLFAAIGGSTGVVTGVAADGVIITYMLPQGCIATMPFTVNPLPSVIAGNRSVCMGTTSAFTDTLTGGTWVSAAPGIATIGSSSGIASGVTLGTATITYTLPTGCAIATTITVNPYPVAITGASLVCQGYFITMSDLTPGGSWSSANTAIATAGSGTGIVTGTGGGSTIISYTLPSGCAVTKSVTVNPLFPVTGSTSLCVGSSYLFSDLAPGGTWSSNTPSVVTISATGAADAHSSGTTIISYTLISGCSASLNVTVNILPPSYNVTGGGNYCAGTSGSYIELNGSDTGVSYLLYRDTSFVASHTGTSAALFYGPYAVSGTYTIRAVNNITGCSSNMSGTATIGITPIVVPSVSVTTTLGDTVCAGASATFKALPVNGGPSPSYQWFVNGSLAGSLGPDSTYSYIPAAGQIVSVTLVSDAICVLPATATASFTVALTPRVMPSVTISVSPGDSICATIPVTVFPVPVYGGSAPLYHWVKNGLDAGWGSTYTYLPANGDNIFGVLHSNYTCLITDTVYSNNVNISVVPFITPSVIITASPGSTISTGQPDTFTAVVANISGITYQWKINGVDIPGATNDTYTNNNLANNDTVSCFVSGSNFCGAVAANGQVVVSVHNDAVQSISGNAFNIRLIPNPSNGKFKLIGNTGLACKHVSLEITNMLGQVVYKKDINVATGNVDEWIQMNNLAANGIYLLTLSRKDILGQTIGENTVFHFVINN